MNKGSIVERLCSDLDRKEPRYKSPTLLRLLYFVSVFFVVLAVYIPNLGHIKNSSCNVMRNVGLMIALLSYFTAAL